MGTISAFILKATVPSSTGICYVSGDFNSWNFYQMTLITTGSLKTFTLDVGTTFTGVFKILSGPDWMFQQVNPQFTASAVNEMTGVNVTAFSIVYNPKSRFIKTPAKNYIEYKGLPYLQYGIQSRIDDYLSSDPKSDLTKFNSLYQYFERTVQSGFKDILLPLQWKSFETGDNEFDYTLLEKYLGNANFYNLRIQLLWFGSNGCGYPFVPDFIGNDRTTYPRISSATDAPLILNNTNLLEKETRAMGKLMDYLKINDLNDRVMMIQIENEPDHKGITTELWAGNQKAAALQSMNTLGKVVHASLASVVTRVNLTGYSTAADTSDYLNLAGIDIFGRDIYQSNLSDFLLGSSLLSCSWNCNHTPENGAQYKNSINLVSADFDKGNGYYMYELRTTGWRTKDYDLGLYRSTDNNDWIERDGSLSVNYTLDNDFPSFQKEVKGSEVKAFNEMIYKADKVIATRPDDKIVAFNTADNQGEVWETKLLPPYSIDYYSPTGGEALALLNDNGEIILFSLNQSTWFKVTSVPANFNFSIGYFDDLNVWHQNRSGLIINNQLTMNAKEVALLTSRTFTTETVSANIQTVQTSINKVVSKSISYTIIEETILINTPDMKSNIKIYDLAGRIVLNKKVEGNITKVEIGDLAKGVYIISIDNNEFYKPIKVCLK